MDSHPICARPRRSETPRSRATRSLVSPTRTLRPVLPDELRGSSRDRLVLTSRALARLLI